MKHRRNTLYAIVLALVLCTGFAYWNLDKCDFVSIDDHQYVSKNHHVLSGINAENIVWAFTTFEAANWHPLTWLSHALDCVLYGSRPAGHHLTNLLLHLINTVLLFLVLKSMTGAVWRSALVAALFGVHPLHVESVAWISERKDVLSTLFLFLSLLCYGWYAARKKPKFYRGSLTFYFLGLLAKPMIVSLPFVMLLLDWWPLRRYAPSVSNTQRPAFLRRFLHLAAEKIPFFVLSAASCAVTLVAQHAGDAIVKATELPFVSRLANVAVAYTAYLGKTFWPAHLAFFYPLPQHYPLAPVVLGCLILAAVSAAALFFAGKFPYLLCGWLWFVGTLVPVIGIVQVGSQAMADRYTYVPLAGLFIALAWSLYDVFGRSRFLRAGASIGSIMVLAMLAFQTRVQAGYWKNDLSLASHALEVTTGNFLAYSVKGNALLDLGRYDEATDCFQKSLALRPTQNTPRLNIGLILLRQGKPEQAIVVFHRLLSLDSNNTLANLNCGNAYGMLGDTQSAIRCYRRAIAVEPWFSAALHNLAVTYKTMKDYGDCRHYLLKAIRNNAGDAESYLSLGDCCLYDKAPRDAVLWYRKSIELAPSHAATHRQMASAFEACGDPDSARYHSALADSLAVVESKDAKP